jgi:FkbM family methyltransferase
MNVSRSTVETLLDELEEELRKDPDQSLFADGRPVHIYGAGSVGKDVFRLLTDRGIRVECFLDRQAKPGTSWENVPMRTPDDPAISAPDRKRAHAVIGIFNCAVEIPPIVELLQSMGYGRVTSFLELHDHFATELGDRFWLTARNFYSSQRAQIAAGYELWTDDESRELYTSILKFRFSKDLTALPRPLLHDQYFPVGLPAWPAPLRFVDCGAYDGDTFRELCARKLSVDAVAAFEPDPANFTQLAKSVREAAPDSLATICLFPCGVGATTAQIRFASGQGMSSGAAESGDTIIQCVALDEALPAFRPNVIKMDIEGAEFEALLGARRMIEAHRPGLAICVYHRPEHLWTIPLLIKAWLPGGRHYLRAHAHNGFDLVYYWMPE